MKEYFIIIVLCITCISAQVSGNTKTKLRSLVFPGWGEQILGESKRAHSFFKREAVLWLFCIGSMKTANWYESDYIAFAELHADVEMTGKDYLFAVNIGHYDNLEEYDDIKERQRLPAEKIYTDRRDRWQWDNKANRIKFDEMRIKSVTYDKYASFAFAGLILHRLISFVDIIYLERQNKPLSFGTHLNGDKDSIELKLSINF